MARGVQPDKHTAYYELLDACATGGCPVCTLTLAAVTSYLQAITYEHVNDPEFRDAIVAARGYCNTHSWRLRELRVALGTALMYRDVIRDAAAELARPPAGGRPDLFGAGQGQGHGGVRGRLSALTGRGAPDSGGRIVDPHRACPACQERDRYELLYLEALLGHIRDERMAQAFADAGGLCMVHLDRLSATTRQSAALERLLAVQRECLLRLHDELTEFVRKNDYRFSGEGMGPERDSWVRAVEIVAGKPGIR
jgi:hypothetical protein